MEVGRNKSKKEKNNIGNNDIFLIPEFQSNIFP